MVFPYTLHNSNRIGVVRPEIPLESRTSGDLKSLAEQLVTKGVLCIVIDAEKTDYVSSEGLHTLFTIHRKMKLSGGILVVARPSREVRSLFQVLQLSEFMPVTETMEEAMKIAEDNLHSSATTGSISSSPSAGQTVGKGSEEPEVQFESPIVVECENCGSFVRIAASGKFLCPSCNVEFNVLDDGTVIF